MTRIHRSLVNMFSSAIGYAVPMLVNVVATPYLLRRLGPAAFGLQSFVSVIIGYLTVMDMGLDLPIIKLLSEDRAKKDVDSENRMLSTTLQLYGVIGLIGMVLIILGADFFTQSVYKIPQEMIPQARLVFRLAGIGFLGSMGLSWGRALAMGLQRFELSYGVFVASNVVGVGLGIVIVYCGYGVIGYVLVRVATSLLSGVAQWVLARKLLPSFNFRWGIHRPTLSRIGTYIGCGVINRAVSGLVSRLDQTLIGIWIGVAAAGVYSVPFLVVSSLGYVISYILGFMFPMASELQVAGDIARLRQIFVRASRFIAAIAGMMFVPLFTLGDEFLTLWVPSIASQAVGVLRLLTLATYVTTLCASLNNNVVVGMGYIRQYTYYATVRALVLSGLCILLIHPFGLLGAGYALLVTGIVDIVFLIYTVRNNMQLKAGELFATAYAKPIILSIVISCLAWASRSFVHSWQSLVIAVVSIECLFIAFGWLIGVFGETERRALGIIWDFFVARKNASDLPQTNNGD